MYSHLTQLTLEFDVFLHLVQQNDEIIVEFIVKAPNLAQ